MTNKELHQLNSDIASGKYDNTLEDNQKKLQEGLGKYQEIDLRDNEEIKEHIRNNPEKYMAKFNSQPTLRKYSILNPEERKRRFLRRLARGDADLERQRKLQPRLIWNKKEPYIIAQHGYLYTVKPGYEILT